ncbi:MAG: PilN domain-containing protein [Gammaproteobacteria bacterium]|nr:PilN domain-containing protein [Gammaproteobacteria bacterium]MCI0591294.1 PilN domain-containing protein [Gammaproteobacteria bacterium]
MAKINLLPWRAALRKERQTRFYITIGLAVVATIAVWGVVHLYFEQLISHQNARNQFLQGQIALLDKKIKEINELEKEKERLLARMRAIERLQANRPLIVRLFDELVKSLPDGVSLTQVSQKGTVITIDGIAQSNARVSSFMRNLEQSPWLATPELDIIQTTDQQGTRISKFTLRFNQVYPQADEKGKGDTASSS